MNKIILLMLFLMLTACHVEKAGVCRADTWQSAQLIE